METVGGGEMLSQLGEGFEVSRRRPPITAAPSFVAGDVSSLWGAGGTLQKAAAG